MVTIATHDGPFHADDVLAVAILQAWHGECRVIRTRDANRLATADIVVDVGGGRYDHHQPGGNGVRPNGIPYAAAGLVWREYGDLLCGDLDVARRVEEMLIQPVDAADTGLDLLGPPAQPTGLRPVTLQSIVVWHNPVNATDGVYDEAFAQAVALMEAILDRAITAARAAVRGEREIRAAVDAYDATGGGPVIVFEAWAPGCVQAAANTPALYAIFPATNGTWRVQAVPEGPTSRRSRRLLPEHWRGLEGAALAEVSGVADAVFCHPAGFIAGAASCEGALALAEEALK